MVLVTETDENMTAAAASSRPLSKVLHLLDNYKPMIPNTVVKNCLQESGFHTEDERLLKLVSVCGQKFLSEILNDSFQIHKARTANPASNNTKANAKLTKDRKFHLTMEDVASALKESGIEVEKPSYFV